MKNPFQSTRIFVGEMVGELKKASWPTRTELRDSTIVVILASPAARDFHQHQRLLALPSGQPVHLPGAANAPPCPIHTTTPVGAQWFALHTLSGQENKVKVYIERFKKAEELDDDDLRGAAPDRGRLRGQERQEDHQGPEALSGLRLHPDAPLRRGRQADQQALVLRQGSRRRHRLRRRRAPRGPAPERDRRDPRPHRSGQRQGSARRSNTRWAKK